MNNFIKSERSNKKYLSLWILMVLMTFNCNFGICSQEKDSSFKNESYGLLCYNYNHIVNHPEYPEDYLINYLPETVNLGDYIQSLAALQYLPKSNNLILMDRDKLKLYDGPEANLIANGWFFLGKDNESFSKNINPLFVSFHINNIFDLSQNTIDYLKQHEPIGCRDGKTCKVLCEKGIKAYFSGCLTTTLDIDYKVNESQRTDNIIFCDYEFGKYPYIDDYLFSLKNYNFNNIEHTTHIFTKESTHEQRFNEAKKLLEKYSKAKLVITTRIHCALPCLAMGTPVILVSPYYDDRRYDDIYELLNTIGNNKYGDFSFKIQFDKKGNVVNSNNYLKYANEIKSTVQNALNIH